QAIIENPDDDSLRLIYADWLDDRGDPRGEFIRIAVALEALERVESPPDIRSRLAHVRRIGQLRRRWRVLLPQVNRSWYAQLHRGRIRCGRRPGGKWPCRWERLPFEPGRNFARYCGGCGRWVRLCWSLREVEQVEGSDRVGAPVLVLATC